MAAISPLALVWLIRLTHWQTAHRYRICADTGANQGLIRIAQPWWLPYKGDGENS
jgi:hypothetical protein